MDGLDFTDFLEGSSDGAFDPPPPVTSADFGGFDPQPVDVTSAGVPLDLGPGPDTSADSAAMFDSQKSDFTNFVEGPASDPIAPMDANDPGPGPDTTADSDASTSNSTAAAALAGASALGAVNKAVQGSASSGGSAVRAGSKSLITSLFAVKPDTAKPNVPGNRGRISLASLGGSKSNLLLIAGAGLLLFALLKK